jgi:predicted HicB family RNase H-like nuclease
MTSANQVESNESAFREVLVDIPDALMTAAQIEAKRLGVSLEQWVADVVTKALAAK